MEIEVGEGTRVLDLIKMLKMPEASIGMVTIDGKLVKAGDHVTEGVEVKFFQPISGG
jgi:sulfur carrier protein ThiS